MAEIYNVNSNTLVSGTSGNDSIRSVSANVTISGKKGNDTIDLFYDYSRNNLIKYSSGDGNDTILGFNSDDTLQITSGKFSTLKSETDFIVKVGKQKIILKDAVNNDFDKIHIKNSSGKVSVYNDWKKWNGTKNTDNFENNSNKVALYAKGGNDFIFNRGDNVTISGDADNDSIYNYGGDYVKILGGAGSDSIYNYFGGDNATISGGAGNDFIDSTGNNVTISADAGNDSIDSSGNDVTISSGKGNDIVTLNRYNSKNNLIKYSSGDGNDTIFGFDSNDTLQITKGKFSTLKSGKDFIVKVGKQKITLKDAVDDKYDKIQIKNSSGKVSVYNDWKKWDGTKKADNFENYSNNVVLYEKSGNNSIDSYGDNVTISGGSGNDSIVNYYGNDVTISGNAGNDELDNFYGNNVTISGDAGNDSIYNDGKNVTISGDAGNDSISNDGDNATISGGAGNDIVKLDDISENTLIKYSSGDGNDTISGFDSNDTLQITKGSYKVSTKNNDVIVTVGKGKITLKDAVGQKISIKDSKGKVTTKTYGKSTSALLEENNFVTADNLSAITKNDLTPTSLEKISSTNFENLTQENNLITYSEK